jgi:hypothetical protein
MMTLVNKGHLTMFGHHSFRAAEAAYFSPLTLLDPERGLLH